MSYLRASDCPLVQKYTQAITDSKAYTNRLRKCLKDRRATIKADNQKFYRDKKKKAAKKNMQQLQRKVAAVIEELSESDEDEDDESESMSQEYDDSIMENQRDEGGIVEEGGDLSVCAMMSNIQRRVEQAEAEAKEPVAGGNKK